MKPADVLRLAEWLYPDAGWWITGNRNRRVLNKAGDEFSLDDRCLQAVEMKLRQQGWVIHRVKREGKPWFRAELKGDGLQVRESNNYPGLLLGLVGDK
jgi:hypothetical protein